MSKILSFLSYTMLGFSTSGILATSGKISVSVQVLNNILISLYPLFILTYIGLIVYANKSQDEQLKEKLYSLLSKDYVVIYVSLMAFLIGLFVFKVSSSVQYYG